MGKIAILHTTTATVEPLSRRIGRECPDARIENFVDDSILPMLLEDEASLPYAFEKLLAYARFAQRQGAQLVLNACSSVGAFREFAQPQLSIPVVRIDDAVASLAVKRGKRIAVLATLPTTLAPSCALLREKSEEAVLTPVLVEGAYQALKMGDRPEHDRLIAGAAERYGLENEVIFLAQASMADAVRGASGEVRTKILTSTEPAVAAVAAIYRMQNANGSG